MSGTTTGVDAIPEESPIPEKIVEINNMVLAERRSGGIMNMSEMNRSACANQDLKRSIVEQ